MTEQLLIQFALRVSLMAIPLYICNGMALVLGGGKPIDMGKKFLDGKRWLGDGKTLRGTFCGIAAATLGAFAVTLAFPEARIFLGADYIAYGFLLAAGAVAGDFAGSFLKRRLGIERGKSVFLLDQLDFIGGGLVFGLALLAPAAIEALFLFAFTLMAHVIGNQIAYRTKIKKVPW